jgi:hypothetical protein
VVAFGPPPDDEAGVGVAVGGTGVGVDDATGLVVGVGVGDETGLEVGVGVGLGAEGAGLVHELELEVKITSTQ